MQNSALPNRPAPSLSLNFPFVVTPEQNTKDIPGRPRRYLRGTEIYAEGSSAKQLYKVVTGAVRVHRVLPDGRRFIVQFALPGEVFGFDGVEDHRFSAEAVTEVVLIAFARKDLDSYIDRQPLAAQSWQAFTVENLAAAQDHFVLLGCRNAMERVSHFLLDLAARSGASHSSLELPMSRYDIADYLGLSAETVSRVLTALRKAGIISIEENHTLHLLDCEELAAAGSQGNPDDQVHGFHLSSQTQRFRRPEEKHSVTPKKS